jgi:hypothetical protein
LRCNFIRRSIDKGVYCTTSSSVNGRVVLLEGRSVTASLGVETRRVSRVGIARVEGAVGVVSRHDKVATHFVESVLALERSGCHAASSNADSDADLVV